MEQATPILESFTESVGDGVSQPLLRKLMSLMLNPEAARNHPIVLAARRGFLENPENIQGPLEDVENIVQSGFRFSSCNSPVTENYFAENRIPIDQIPLEMLLHEAVSRSRTDDNRLRSPTASRHRITGFEQLALPGDMLSTEEGISTGACSTSGRDEGGHGHGNDEIVNRLDRLESICSRTESYLRMVLGILDRRLQVVEAKQGALFPDTLSRDSSGSPMSPIFPTRTPCDVSTFVTPDMFISGLKIVVDNTLPSTSDACVSPIIHPTSDVCLSPIEAIPSPSLFTFSTPVSQEQQQQPESLFSRSSEVSAGAKPPQEQHFQRPSDSDRLAEVQTDYFPVRVCPGATQESTPDALLREPVVVWTDGIPYLRPTRQMKLANQSRDNVVATWDSLGYLSRPSGSDDKDGEVTTYMSSNDSIPQQAPHNINLDSISEVPEGSHKQEGPEAARPDCGLACSRVHHETDDGPAYMELPQNEEPDEQPSSGYEMVPKVTLAFNNQERDPPEQPHSRHSSSDMCVKVGLPGLQAHERDHAQPTTVHVAVAPKELPRKHECRRATTSADLVGSIVQDISVSVEGPFEGQAQYDIVQQLPSDSREAVALCKDKLHLTEDVVADYTMKAVQDSRSQGQGPGSVIHELCFSVDVPTEDSRPGASSELPLEVAISLSGNPPHDRNVEPKKDIASVVLSLEALEKASVPAESSLSFVSPMVSPRLKVSSRTGSQNSLDGYLTEQEAPGSCQPMAFNWEGVPGDNECDDIPCLLDRRNMPREEVPAVKEQVCISVEVPNEVSRTTPSGVQIGVAVRTLPTSPDTSLITESMELEKVPFEEMAQQREMVPCKEELVPLTAAENMCLGICHPHEDILVPEPLATPAPSPVDLSPVVDSDISLFKEQVKESKFDMEDWGIESIFLVAKEMCPSRAAKVPKAVVEGITAVDLIRGSLHYDGKSCLLSVCMEDFWTADDMCQAPQSPTLKPKSNFEPFCLRGCGDKTRLQVFGFFQQAPDNNTFGFFSGPVTTVLGLDNKKVAPSLSPSPSPQQQQPAVTRPSLDGNRKGLSVDLPGDNSSFSDWDSALSVVSRSPVKQAKLVHTGKPEEEPKTRTPGSPGARSCIIDGEEDVTCKAEKKQEDDKAKVPDSPGAQACMMRGESPKMPVAKNQEPGKGSFRKHQQILELLESGGGGGGGGGGDLHVLMLESPGTSRSSMSSSQDEFFDALQCSGRRSIQGKRRKFRRFFKDKILSRFACYGYGIALVDSDFSDGNGTCHHHHEKLTA